ncbi:MAG: hypothetical protein H0X37_14415 [Herpetosiphonaceae bacterium]|nr:hypothetical protein [Herpetosiphonaceae bacterium]
MHGPTTPTMGRGMLLFAALIFALGLYLLVSRQWLNAGLWLAIAVFMSCYGTLMSARSSRWDKALLGIATLAGLVAFGLVIKLFGFGF